MEYAKGQKVIWVIGRINGNSPRGKSILEHAKHGIGYKIINQGRASSEDVIFAFKRSTVDACPHHLQPASAIQVKKLEKADGLAEK